MINNKNVTRDQLKEILEDELFQNLLFHTADSWCSHIFTRSNKYSRESNLTEDDLDSINRKIKIGKVSEPSPSKYFSHVAFYYIKSEIESSIDYLEKFLEVYDKPIEKNLIDFLTEYAFKVADRVVFFEENVNKYSNFIKAKYLSTTGNYQDAIPLFESLLGNFSKEEEKEFLYFLILDHLEINQFDKAMEYCNKYLSFDPDDLRIYRLLGKYHHNIKEYDKAFEFFNKEKENFYKRFSDTKNNEKATYDYRGLISLCITTEKLEELIQEFEKLIALNPDNEVLLTHLAYSYLIKRDYEKSFKIIDKALSINPYYYFTLSVLATNYHYEESYNKAIYYFKESIKVQYRDIWVYERLGMTYIKIKDFDNAIRIFEFISSIWSGNGYAYFALGKIYEHIGKDDLATEYFEKASKLKPFYIDRYQEIIF